MRDYRRLAIKKSEKWSLILIEVKVNDSVCRGPRSYVRQ